ncbi:MAG: hypothetical protein QM778_36340 [Myxococcales bacterium]
MIQRSSFKLYSALLLASAACGGDVNGGHMLDEDAGETMDASHMGMPEAGPAPVVDAGSDAAVEDPYQVCSSDGWCFEQPLPTVADLFTGVRVSPTQAWFGGERGTLLSYDGVGIAGAASGTESALRGMFAFSPTDAWAVGDATTVLRFDGTKWSPLATGTDGGTAAPEELQAVWGASADDVWIVGRAGALWRAQAGVLAKQTAPSGDHFHAIWGSSASDIFAVGDKGASMHYDGTKWTKSPALPSTGKNLLAIHGTGPTDVWAVGAAGIVLHFDGMKWSAVELTLPKVDLWAVRAISATEVLVVGAEGATYRYDGTTWHALTSGVDEIIHGIVPGEAGRFMTVGNHGTAIEWNGEVRNTFSEGPRTNHLAQFDGKDGALWILGDGTEKLTEAGYETVDTGTPRSLYGGFAPSAAVAWAVGTNGTIVRRKDGKFAPMESGTMNWLRSVWGPNESSAWLVGDKGTVLGLLNGASWQKISAGATVDLYAVWGTSLEDAWTVGDMGTAVHWDGTSWTPIATNSTAGLRSLWGSAANDVWAAGTLGTVLHWNGQAWVISQSGAGYSLNSIWGTGPSDIYAVGSGGTIVHYDGSAWTQQSSPTDRALFSVMAGPDGVLRAVGEDGVVLTKR